MSGTGIDPNTVGEWIRDGNAALSLFRGALGLLPKGPDREKVEAQVNQAEEALKRTEASVAKELGYSLCKCTFPPQIMLWKQDRKAHVCPNPECRHEIPMGMRISDEALEWARRPKFRP